MSKSSRLQLPQIRSAFRLVQECCDLGADPAAWRTHLLRGLTTQLRCKLAIGGRADLNLTLDRASMIRSFGDVGWATAAERSPYVDWITRGAARENPVSARIAATGTVRMTAMRRELIGDDAWYRSPLIQAFAETALVDDVVFSFALLERARYVLLVGQREVGDRRFNARDRGLLELISDEVLANLGGRLATFDEPSVADLSPRLQTILRRLLAGDSPKEVAVRLGISVHTVYEHVKRLHRHFKVSSRGELMARCRRLPPVLDSDPGGSD